MLHAFDQPVMETNCERRTVSTVATQSLMLMNSEFILQQAGYFAARIRKEAAGDPTPPGADGLATGLWPRAGTGASWNGPWRSWRRRRSPRRRAPPAPRRAPAPRSRRAASAGRSAGRSAWPTCARCCSARTNSCTSNEDCAAACRHLRSFAPRRRVSGRKMPWAWAAWRWPGCCARRTCWRAPHIPRDDRAFDMTAKPPHAPPQRPGHDLAVHARRTQPRRPARSQARADRSTAAATIRARSSTASPIGPARSCSAARGSSPSTASAAPRFPSCCRTWPRSSTTSP